MYNPNDADPLSVEAKNKQIVEESEKETIAAIRAAWEPLSKFIESSDVNVKFLGKHHGDVAVLMIQELQADNANLVDANTRLEAKVLEYEKHAQLDASEIETLTRRIDELKMALDEWKEQARIAADHNADLTDNLTRVRAELNHFDLLDSLPQQHIDANRDLMLPIRVDRLVSIKQVMEATV